MSTDKHFSPTVTVFRRYTLPEDNMTLTGYSSLIYYYNLAVPLPYFISALSQKNRRYQEGRWLVFTPRHKPDDTLSGHLTFALKYEGIDLHILKAVFDSVEGSEIEEIVRNEPTGRYTRRIWFFYEWLTGEQLNLPDVETGNYVDALDPVLQYPGSEKRSRRHRVRNNLPGTVDFCPLIRRTEKLEEFRAKNLDEKVNEVLGAIHSDLLARASAFLLLKDSKASYAIEGERPPHNRAERWGRAIGRAGQQELTKDELLRLQEIVIADRRFVDMGWRKEGGFVGVHDRITGNPLPVHISARWQDVPRLMDGLIETDNKLNRSNYDPVLAATLIAFGFVFIHPFADGNGRIHRYLIHHVLAAMGFAPKGLIFPVSAVILERIGEYKEVLESYSSHRLELIDWEPTDDGNVQINNETIDLYRYFDATQQAEFLFDCVRETILETLPEEVQYLEHHSEMRQFIEDRFDMPDKEIENLIGFLRQNEGKLSKHARAKKFKKLTEDEVESLENEFSKIFEMKSVR